MSDESLLQKEWRDIVINKLDRIEADQKAMQSQLANGLVTAADVKSLKENVLKVEVTASKLESSIEAKYVTKADFRVVEKLVYSAAGLILLGVFGALIALVIKR